MASVNKVILVGNIGKDPEVRYSANGNAICNVSIATSRQWKDKTSGEKREETDWHTVVFFNRLAEIVGEYLTKGKSIYVEGRLQTRKWQDKDGNDKWSTEVMADQMQMLGGAGGNHEQSESVNQPAQAPAKAPPSATSPNFDDMDENEIPF